MEIANALKKMSFKDVITTFEKLQNSEKLVRGLFEDYSAKKMIVIPADKYALKSENNKTKANLQEMQEHLSYVTYFKANPCCCEDQAQYYNIIVPTVDDFLIKDSNSNFYNLVIVQENKMHLFAKSLIVKKEDVNKPAFFKNCYHGQASLIVFE